MLFSERTKETMQESNIAAPRTEVPVTDDEPPLLVELELDFDGHGPSVLSPKLSSLACQPQWSDWQWQMRNRIRSVAHLGEVFPSLELSTGMASAAEKFPLAVTPYYASLMRKLDASDPVYCMALPQGQELWNPPFLRDDPLEEDHDMPVPGLVHRYADRALLIATSACAMYCRHCTRKRVTGCRETCMSESRLRRCVEYLSKHPEIHDVVISGGDPLTLPTDALEQVVAAVRSVKTVDVIRIGTRTPVTLPFRITDELVAMLRKYHPVWVNTHFNHPNEITPESTVACQRLADAGIPVGNQSVLLKGINDDPGTMESLLRGLLRMRVRPYYLFQCDLVPGVEHFRTPLSQGIEIMESLRGRLGGIGIPTFVVDMPHGGGKVPVLPNYVVSTSPTHTVLRNFEGMLVSYPEPYAEERRPSDIQPIGDSPSVWDLSSGQASKIEPAATARQTRRKQVRVPVSE
jgi:lysine 2,3-aminomutase